MEYVIQGRKPASFFRYFEEISAIPRASYHEDQIADYLVAFAKQRGLEYFRDEWNNVLIKKPATKGREGVAPILFQGHTDMICEKNSGVEHDFLKDPLELYVDGDLLRARGTTLGADDGMAVATMLALLDGEVESHPAYECLFTAIEEPGLVGAMKFDFSRISAHTMVNIDCGNQNVILCSCAGGMRTELTLPYKYEKANGKGLRVYIKGLLGGHSGASIHKGLANANKVMGRMLAELLSVCDARLASVDGRAQDNAITRECEAVLLVSDYEKAASVLTTCADRIAKELVKEDRDFCVTVEPCEPEAMMSREDTMRVCAVLACVANGVFTMCQDMTYLVEYSRNLGSVATESESVKFGFYTRSPKESQLDATVQELDALAAAFGGATKHHSRYPGWEFSKSSPIRQAYMEACRKTMEKAPIAVGVHAGLECGIVCTAIPGMDAISIGPNCQHGHSPNEAMNLASCEEFWRALRVMIEAL